MIITCNWCPDGSPTKDMGEKEPLDDTSETSGICDACFAKQVAKIDAMKKKRKEK